MTGQRHMSTCGELTDYLSTQPRDRPVILQKDAEGNEFSPLFDAAEKTYIATSTWSGEIVSPDGGYEGAARVVVLGPVN